MEEPEGRDQNLRALVAPGRLLRCRRQVNFGAAYRRVNLRC